MSQAKEHVCQHKQNLSLPTKWMWVAGTESGNSEGEMGGESGMACRGSCEEYLLCWSQSYGWLCGSEITEDGIQAVQLSTFRAIPTIDLALPPSILKRS